MNSNLSSVSDLKLLLKSFGFFTNSDLGQNFLVCHKSLQNIIDTANIQADDEIIEIGPGPGVLTKALLNSPAKKVTALEIDAKLIPILKKTTSFYAEKLEIININALEFTPNQPNYILVANIPYYLTSPILRHFLAGTCPPKKAVILVQKEVAQKICASAQDQSILSLQVNIYGQPKLIKIVDRNCFFPSPQVDSAILSIDMFPQCLIPEPYLKQFWQITKLAFNQKRKKIANTLGKQKINTQLTFNDIFKMINIDAERRPQTLSISEWLKILEANKEKTLNKQE